MKINVELDLRAGPNNREHVTKKDLDKNIWALEEAAAGRCSAKTMVLLMDTLSILEQIKNQLPDGF